jgi:hypothetical protein
MVSNHDSADQTDRQICTCSGCGRRITLLRELQSLALYLGETSVQRRGFQCANCKQVICFECSHCGHCCTCRCNAWVALPYLESMAMGSAHT